MVKHPLSKDEIKIILLEGVHESAVEVFKNQGYNNIEQLRMSLSVEDLKVKVADAHIIGIRSNSQLTEPVIKAAKNLVVIGCFCISTNQVDTAAAQRYGVPVFNAPYANARSVAELVLAEIVFLLRGIAKKNTQTHQGIWEKSAINSYEARNKTLGVIGYGHIGMQVGLLAEMLGMNILYYDIETKMPLGNAKQASTLNALLQQADVISLHVPDTQHTQYMFSQEEFDKMKNGVMLINTARGSILDINSLAVALKTGKVAGAAIDVFPIEPKNNNEVFYSVLQEFDNVILTPHIGGTTIEAQENIALEVAKKVLQYLEKGTSVGAVNFPQLLLPAQGLSSANGVSRILHVHKNQLGIMNLLNHLLADHQVNIAGQFLQTDENIGYVVIDVESLKSLDVITALKEVKGTIRTRVLY